MSCVLADLEHGMHCVRLRCIWRNAFVVRRGCTHAACLRHLTYGTLCALAPPLLAPTIMRPLVTEKGQERNVSYTLPPTMPRAKSTAAFSKQHAATLFGALAMHALLTHALVLPSIHRARVPPITRYCDSSKGINLLSQQG